MNTRPSPRPAGAASEKPWFRHWFAPRAFAESPRLRINALGVREPMRPGMIDRPGGTGDWLFMLFHSPACMGTRPVGAGENAAPPETMIVWPRGESQHYGHRAAGYLHSWLHCDGSDVGRMVRKAGLPVRQPFSVRLPALFQQCLMDIHTEILTHGNPDPVIVRNLLENALRGLGRDLSSPALSSPVERRLGEVRRHIAVHYEQPATLDSLARMAGMSAPYFCARFKARFGLSPVACLIRHRLQHAAGLLAHRDLNITEVAAEVGYDDPFHFSKLFKRHFGKSPRALRDGAKETPPDS
ncbi:MAG TPA: AraC family transcriptional regulator [Rariglobus sp.]